MLAALKAGNLILIIALTVMGSGAFAVMTYPLWPTPRPRPVMSAAIDRRWLPPEPPPLPKADRLQLAAADPLGPPVQLQPPPTSPGGPVEQALERKAEDQDAERATAEYHRTATRRGFLSEDRRAPHHEAKHGDTCTRHGGVKVTSRHGRSWHCRYPRD